jgi:hypothetical protein
MKGFKGFDKDMKCRGLQYEVGKTVVHPGTVSLCNSGLHFCEHPLDTWRYYKPNDGSRYAEVEAEGEQDKGDGDSKRCSRSLTVRGEVKIPALLKAAVEFVFKKATATTGNYAHSATTGYSAHSATTGDSAHSATTGYSAHSATTGNSAHSATTGDFAEASVAGKNTIAASLGVQGKAKGAVGCFLVLAEYDGNGNILAVGVDQVDGKKIKADTFYMLEGGKFKAVRP